MEQADVAHLVPSSETTGDAEVSNEPPVTLSRSLSRPTPPRPKLDTDPSLKEDDGNAKKEKKNKKPCPSELGQRFTVLNRNQPTEQELDEIGKCERSFHRS